MKRIKNLVLDATIRLSWSKLSRANHSLRLPPPWYLRDGHVQTILPVLLPRGAILTFERERWELADGDFLDLDWSRSGRKRVAILSHGSGGVFAERMHPGHGGDAHRGGLGCAGLEFSRMRGNSNRLLRFYHSGETGDLAAVIEYAAGTYERIALIGFSLGGNVTLKYLGEERTHPAVVAGAGISVPVDLASSCRSWIIDGQTEFICGAS